MPKSRIPSPARSQGGIMTPRRYKPRVTRSVGSPARSNTSGRLTSVIQDSKDKNMDSFALSPLTNRRSLLTDNTDIEEPKRRSWWKKLNENSRDVIEVLKENDIEVNNVIEEYADVEVLSQEKKDYSLNLPESSDSESISSIVIPQRKLFTEKNNQNQNKFGNIIGPRESLAKLNKTKLDHEKTIKAGPRNLFAHSSKPKKKPAFPAELLQISPNKTTNKTKEIPFTKVKGQTRNLFGQRVGGKRKNMFADFIVSDSEDEIPEIQPKVFCFHKKSDQLPNRRLSPISRGIKDASPTANITTDIDLDEWKLLPSSTMVQNQLEDVNMETPTKKARFTKLSEAKESETASPERNNDFQNDTMDDDNDTTYNENEVQAVNEIQEDSEEVVQKDSQQAEAANNKNNEIQNERQEFRCENKVVGKTDEDDANIKSNEFENQIKENTKSQKDSQEIQNKSPETMKETKEKSFDNQDEPSKGDESDHKIQKQHQKSQNSSMKKSSKIIDEDKLNKKKLVTDQDGPIEEKITDKEIQNENQESKNGSMYNQGESPETIEENGGDEPSNKKTMPDQDKPSEHDNTENYNQEIQNESQESQNDSMKSDNESPEAMEDNDENEPSNEDNTESDNEEMQNESQESQNDSIKSEDEGPVAIAENDENEPNKENSINDQDKSNEEDNTESGMEDQEIQDEGPEAMAENEECELSKENSIVDEDEPNEEDSNESDSQEIQNESQKSENDSIKSHSESPETMEETDDNETSKEESNAEQNGLSAEESNAEQNEISEQESDPEQEKLMYEESDAEEDTQTQEESDSEQDQISDTEQDTPDPIHNKSERSQNKDEAKSPEVILHDMTNQMDSFNAQGRNTSIRKTTLIKNLTIRPSVAPPARESTGISDGTKNSSAEGSGWDSHRTTRKTLRQTFGRDFTPRKSLRALVMEKSAKRQTAFNEMNPDLIHKPRANSTELPDNSNHGDGENSEENIHEVSKRTRQTTLEMYLQKIKKENMERKMKLEEAVRNSLKSTSRDTNLFKVPSRPTYKLKRPSENKIQNKPKLIKSMIPLGDLPQEVLEDMKYKPPKRFRPSNASWITKRLYKFLETKLEPKYDYKARVRAEKLVETIYNFTKDIRRHDRAPADAVELLKQEMARLDVVQTHFEFYEFFHEFMPREIRVKVVPDVVNSISLPRHGVFAEILPGNIVQG